MRRAGWLWLILWVAPAWAAPSVADHWLGVMLEVAGRDVERVGARPTILSRQMAIVATCMYDAWAVYDPKARSTVAEQRRPVDQGQQAAAIAWAAWTALRDQYPECPVDPPTEGGEGAEVGRRVAQKVLEIRHHDGSNQLGDEPGGSGAAYSDYTGYQPFLNNPDHWQPLYFSDGKGGRIRPMFLTPHWFRVKPFALQASDQFRPGPPPRIGSQQLKEETDECLRLNADLSIEEKALVELMRDGPRSTGQSGHWLHFARVVSRRDQLDLDQDIKLYFAVSNVCMDAFIAAWESKRYYDSSRPFTLIRHYYAGQRVRGWLGPGSGVGEIDGSQWIPYSPATFVTPPFPGYVSGHSCVSAAAAEILKRYTGSDRFEQAEERQAGELTEPGFDCPSIQQVDGQAGGQQSCFVKLHLPTFSEAAKMAGRSRVLGGYHIESDNREGLKLGGKVAEYSWPIYRSYFEGR